MSVYLLGTVWAEGKEERTTSRHRMDSGQFAPRHDLYKVVGE
jgi:hypothetical protein